MSVMGIGTALFLGFVYAFVVAMVLSNIFKHSTTIWLVGAIVIFIATVVCVMLELTTVLTVGTIALWSCVCLFLVIRWLANL